MVFRYGGEEFFIIAPNTDFDGVSLLAKRLHGLIKQYKFPVAGKVTVSMGVVSYEPGESVDELIKRADDLLYQAKRQGRNQIQYGRTNEHEDHI